MLILPSSDLFRRNYHANIPDIRPKEHERCRSICLGSSPKPLLRLSPIFPRKGDCGNPTEGLRSVDKAMPEHICLKGVVWTDQGSMFLYEGGKRERLVCCPGSVRTDMGD